MIDTEALRQKVLDLAIRGKLTEQLSEDGTAEELYAKIQREKQALIKEGKVKKAKPLPPVSEDEIPFEVPDNWKWIKIGDIFTLKAGKNIAASKIHDVPNAEYCYPCFGGNGIRGYTNQINISGRHALIGRQGALCGNINFAEGDFYATEHAVVVYEYAGTDTKWAGIFLRVLNLNQYATSVAQPGLAVNRIEKVLIPLPPLAEQSRIVEKVESIFSVLDKIDQLQSEYSANLSALKSKIIEAGIQGELTKQLPEDGTAEELLLSIRKQKRAIENSGILKGRKSKSIEPIDEQVLLFQIPVTWKWVRLGEIAEIFGRIGFRGYKKSDIVESGHGAISISPSNITNTGKLVFDKCTHISWDKYEESPEIMVNEEDVLIVKTGSTYGKSGIVHRLPEKATINPQLAILKYVLCDRYYLNYILNSSFARKQYEEFVVGAAVPTFSQEKLANFIMPLPPLAEQNRIVAKLDEALAIIESGL